MIPFPDISPNVFSVTLFGREFALRWYALAYMAGLLYGWWIILRAIRTPRLWAGEPPLTAEQVERFFTWAVVGVILGGRLGYVIFYEPATFLAEPWRVPYVWEGGMSFHGGFAGVVLAGLWFCRREKIPMLSMGDLLAIAAPLGLGLGRLSNFVNAELWGRPTDLPWGVVFPGAAAQTCAELTGACARHPSQLYQAALEGLLLLVVLTWLAFRRGWFKRPGALMGLFLVGYGVARFLVEFVRQPDAQFVSPGNPIGWAVQAGDYGLTMGQLLSLPMIAAGLWFGLRAREE
ncbi:prolipoprotein diacylglyceryl transferase [Tabrizicola sp.]|jgi:phosphatidylglycerol:prolipoprotein diacylglycerol transferase|uniref:prolipoprotein diacylglyceryl transferase n=1 Tax=Tabrizicola sp. TaxID=2005166 RepID=UPI0035AD7F27